jgi:cytochrome oxidase Cu insertion factor (SCO1/SenC/PrrC family)
MHKITLLAWIGAILMVLLTACANNNSQAPDFTLANATGKEVSLSDFKGKPVLLYFHMAVG